MTNEFRIRVTMQNGSDPIYHMMRGETALAELSFIDVVEFATQAASVLRYQKHDFKPAKR